MKKLPEIRHPQDQDIEDWLEATDDVIPFKQPVEKPQSPLIIDEIKSSLCVEGLYNPNSFTELKVGNTDNIDKNSAEKFLKGKYKIDAQLDLHGQTEKQAFLAVEGFIKNSYMRNHRCVLIITGKGVRKDDDPWYESKGVIKEALPSWLNHPDIRPFILSISYAKQEDGGSGAMYVLLKRQRGSHPSKKF